MRPESVADDVESRRVETSVDPDLAALLAVGVGAWSVALVSGRLKKTIRERRRLD